MANTTTRNSIQNKNLLIWRYYEEFCKTGDRVRVFGDFSEDTEKSINDDLITNGKKAFYHYSIKSPKQPNYFNFRNMVQNRYLKSTNKKLSDLTEDEKWTIDSIASKLTDIDSLQREKYFGKYVSVDKIFTTGKIIGGSFSCSNSKIENGILTYKYVYHTDIMVPAPIFTKEYSKLTSPPDPTKEDIIRVDGLGQTTLSWLRDVRVFINLSDPSQNNVVCNLEPEGNFKLLDEYNIFLFFERIKNTQYKNSDFIKNIKYKLS